MSAVTDVKKLLTDAGLDVHDDDPRDTPAGLYVVLDYGPGLAQPHRLSTVPHWTGWSFTVKAVSRTVAGLNATITKVRGAVTGHRVHGGVVRETAAGPRILDGPEGDRRYSTTLYFTAPVYTEGALT